MEPPSRWLKCPRKGALVKEIFLPCKTPLDAKFNSTVPLQYRFDLDMLFASMAQYQYKIGMVIDLTNTTRFYSKEAVQDNYKCKHLKLNCKGHGETPSVDQVTMFINCVNSFRRRFPLDKIAVHCTHGFNRTGFMIVSYLVMEMDWSAERAVQAFADARPPGIYKQDYLEEIWSRYDDANECPTAPQLPDWCWEEDEKDDDNGELADAADQSSAFNEEDAVVPASSGGGRKRPGWSGQSSSSDSKSPRIGGGSSSSSKVSQFMPGVEKVEQVLDSEIVRRVRERVQRACKFGGSRFPGCQPVSMDANNLELLATKHYKVSWKADGFRYMMAILGRGEVFAIDRDNSVFRVPNLVFPKRKEPDEHLSDTVLDGELVIDNVDGVKRPRYLIYDVASFESMETGGCQFSMRELCIQRELIEPRSQMKERLASIGSKQPDEPFSVRLKGFYNIGFARKLLSKEFTDSLGHETDGLIFQPADRDDVYIGGSLHTLLKWKPPELNTVDFKLQWFRKRDPGCLEEHFGALYAGGEDSPVARIKMKRKDAANYDGKIVECKFDRSINSWVILKERLDKSFPNKLDTVKAVIESILRPVTKEKLLQFIDDVESRRRSADRRLMPPPPTIASGAC